MKNSDTSRPNQELFPETSQASENDCGDYVETEALLLRKGYFTAISNEVVDTFPLLVGAYAFTLYIILAKMAGARETAFPSKGYLAKVSGISESQVKRSIKILIWAGLLQKKTQYRRNGSQTVNLYTIIDSPELIPVDPYPGTPRGSNRPKALIEPGQGPIEPPSEEDTLEESKKNSSSATLQKNSASGYAQEGKGRDSYATLKSPRIDVPPTTSTLIVDSPPVTLQEVGHGAQAKEAAPTSGQSTLKGGVITNVINENCDNQKESLKVAKKPIGFLPNTKPDAVALAKACEDLCRLPACYSQTRFARELKPLIKMQATVELLQRFKTWWYRHDFRGKRDQSPTMPNLADLWRVAQEDWQKEPVRVSGYDKVDTMLVVSDPEPSEPVRVEDQMSIEAIRKLRKEAEEKHERQRSERVTGRAKNTERPGVGTCSPWDNTR